MVARVRDAQPDRAGSTGIGDAQTVIDLGFELLANMFQRDNATTLIGQMRDQRPPFSKSDAEAIKTPTLFIGGANTKGTLPKVLNALATNVRDSRTAMISGTTHPMFEQAPQKYCEIVLAYLAED